MQWLVRLRVFIIICLAVVLISTAVIFSVMRALLPHATGYKNEIQQEISRQVGLPVEFDSLDAATHWFSPRLRLLSFSVYDEKHKVPLFNFEEAFVGLDIVASLLRWELIVDDIGLVGADISIEKLSEKDWVIQGIQFTGDGSSELPEQFTYMLQNSNYLLHNCNIYYQDYTDDKLSLELLDINMDVNNAFNHHDIRFSMNLPESYGKELSVVANLYGDIDDLSGDLYVEATRVKAKQWNHKFKLTEDFELDAIADVSLWVVLDEQEIIRLVSEVQAEHVHVTNNHTGKEWSTEYLAGNSRIVNTDDNWHLSVTDFYFGEKNNPAWGIPINVIASLENKQLSLEVDKFGIKDLVTMSSVMVSTDQLKLVDKVDSYALSGEVYNLSMVLPFAEGWHSIVESFQDNAKLSASLVDLAFNNESGKFSVTGLDTAVEYQSGELILDIASNNTSLDFISLFRQPLNAELIEGSIHIGQEENGWLIRSEKLQVFNSHINTYSRLTINIDESSSASVDVQTNVFNADGGQASLYLPIGIMDEELVKWLDTAIIGGGVPSGQFILYGRLDEFPYRQKTGKFQVLFHTQDVKLSFLEDWPVLDKTGARVEFLNESLYITEAVATSNNINLYNGSASIADLDDPVLVVESQASGSNENVQQYIWNSKLDEILGDAFRLFQLKGSSELELKLDVPLNTSDYNVGVNGALILKNSELYYPVMGYGLEQLTGTIKFTEETIFADSITAKVQGRPVEVKAFTQKQDTSSMVTFHLDGVLSTDYLLQHFDWVPVNWLSGESVWSIDLNIPYVVNDHLAYIEAKSQLEGTVVSISDKVNKPAQKILQFGSRIDVLSEHGLRAEVKVTDLQGNKDHRKLIMDVHGVRDSNYIWNINIASPYISGKGEFTEGLGRDTTILADLHTVDLHTLTYNSDDTAKNALMPNKFPSLNWHADTLLWEDWTFNDVNLETSWHRHGMVINRFELKGPAMHLNSRGTWLTSWKGGHETVLQGNLSSSHCGETLSGLGFQRSVDGCSFNSNFDSKWSAEPYAVSWELMQGKTSFKMEKGEIVELDPGAGGRLLGLLNLFKIANRLVLDFSDISRNGFAFDTITGDFDFVNGNGSLKDFKLSSSAADVDMFGSIGLVDHDYGLLMRVKPQTDSLTFAGGALLGGLTVGAGLALIQKVFDLGVIGHDVYSITGSWDEPVIEKIIEKNDDINTTDEDDF